MNFELRGSGDLHFVFKLHGLEDEYTREGFKEIYRYLKRKEEIYDEIKVDITEICKGFTEYKTFDELIRQEGLKSEFFEHCDEIPSQHLPIRLSSEYFYLEFLIDYFEYSKFLKNGRILVKKS